MSLVGDVDATSTTTRATREPAAPITRKAAIVSDISCTRTGVAALRAGATASKTRIELGHDLVRQFLLQEVAHDLPQSIIRMDCDGQRGAHSGKRYEFTTRGARAQHVTG